MSVRTRRSLTQDQTTSIERRGHLGDLFADALRLIREDKRGEPEISQLETALQLFMEQRLGAVISSTSLKAAQERRGFLMVPTGTVNSKLMDAVEQELSSGLSNGIFSAILMGSLKRNGLYFVCMPGEDTYNQMPIEMLGLHPSIESQVRGGNIESVGDLLRHRKDELLRFPNLGPRSVAEIESALGALGLHLDRP